MLDEVNIPVGNFTYSLDEKGAWIHKAKQPAVFKSDGTLKAKYKEMPRYGLIYDIDDFAQKQMEQQLNYFVKDVKTLMNKT